MCTSFYVCITTAPEVALSSIWWPQAFSSIWWHQAASEVAISSIRWHWAELSAVESEWILLVDSFAKKSKFPFEQIFLEPWDPKIWLLYSIYYQNYYVLRKDIHSQILKENLKYYEFFGLKSAKWL